MRSRKWLELFCTLMLGIILLSACGGAPGGGTSVWIDVPLDGLTFPEVQAVKIEGHATAAGGVSRVEIWINGALLTTVNDPLKEGDLTAFHTEWTPSTVGEYTIQAIAFGADGTSSQPDSARVRFGAVGMTPISNGCPTPVGGGPTPVSCAPVENGCPTPIGGGPTPVSCAPEVSGCPTPIGGGPTPVSCTPLVNDPPSPVDVIVQFSAEPATIQAGACTTLRWHVENAQRVIFGGIDQPFDGSYKDCLCKNELYTLKVIKADGTEERSTANINVTGSCVTEAPPPPAEAPPPAVVPLSPGDTTPPPVPNPAVPANGLELSCRSTQTVAWLPVTDDSGISGYYVKLEMEVKPGQWRSAGGYGPVSGKQVNVNVQCGGVYRWMVRAQDGAGNFSNWSTPSTFSVTLN